MYASGATCLSAVCCCSELALYKSKLACWSGIKRTSSLSSSFHQNVNCSRHDIAFKCGPLVQGRIQGGGGRETKTFSCYSVISQDRILVTTNGRFIESQLIDRTTFFCMYIFVI